MKFNWKGDLKDDCFCNAEGFTAHCELLADNLTAIAKDNGHNFDNIEIWFVGVYRDYTPPCKDEDVLFHSGEHDGMITSGDMARAIAEAILKGYLERATLTEVRS